MAQLIERVRILFEQSIESQIFAADFLAEAIVKASERLVKTLLESGKIFLCGNGGSAANCAHFSAAMINHFDVERPPLPVISLTTDGASISAVANDGLIDQVYARQIQALGDEGDVLIAISCSGNSNNVINAVHAANERGMDTIAMTGRDGGILANHLGPEDIELRVPSDSAARIREMHLFILHCFCNLIDKSLFDDMVN